MMLGYVLFVGVPALLSGSWLFYGVWPNHSIRQLRDELFVVRDKLFALAADPNIDLEYQDVAYGMLRSNINGYIRFADTISLLTMWRLSRVSRPPGLRPWSERWGRHLEECPADVANTLRSLHVDALSAVFRHALRTSLFAQIVIGAAKLSAKFRGPVESAGEAYGEEHRVGCAVALDVARA